MRGTIARPRCGLEPRQGWYTPTGLRRLALTDADREMRDLFARWCRDASCTLTVDRMGNMFRAAQGPTTRSRPC
jgi:hypothetical protein